MSNPNDTLIKERSPVPIRANMPRAHALSISRPVVQSASVDSSSSDSMAAAPTTRVVKTRRVGIPKFLRFLREIVDDEDDSIIRWGNGGVSLQILDIDELTAKILPRYFRHSKYTSFQRQLNYFGFKKWTKTRTDICTFSHPHFTRNNPENLVLIKRKNQPLHPGSRQHVALMRRQKRTFLLQQQALNANQVSPQLMERSDLAAAKLFPKAPSDQIKFTALLKAPLRSKPTSTNENKSTNEAESKNEKTLALLQPQALEGEFKSITPTWLHLNEETDSSSDLEYSNDQPEHEFDPVDHTDIDSTDKYLTGASFFGGALISNDMISWMDENDTSKPSIEPLFESSLQADFLRSPEIMDEEDIALSSSIDFNYADDTLSSLEVNFS